MRRKKIITSITAVAAAAIMCTGLAEPAITARATSEPAQIQEAEAIPCEIETEALADSAVTAVTAKEDSSGLRALINPSPDESLKKEDSSGLRALINPSPDESLKSEDGSLVMTGETPEGTLFEAQADPVSGEVQYAAAGLKESTTEIITGDEIPAGTFEGTVQDETEGMTDADSAESQDESIKKESSPYTKSQLSLIESGLCKTLDDTLEKGDLVALYSGEILEYEGEVIVDNGTAAIPNNSLSEAIKIRYDSETKTYKVTDEISMPKGEYEAYGLEEDHSGSVLQQSTRAYLFRIPDEVSSDTVSSLIDPEEAGMIKGILRLASDTSEEAVLIRNEVFGDVAQDKDALMRELIKMYASAYITKGIGSSPSSYSEESSVPALTTDPESSPSSDSESGYELRSGEGDNDSESDITTALADLSGKYPEYTRDADACLYKIVAADPVQESSSDKSGESGASHTETSFIYSSPVTGRIEIRKYNEYSEEMEGVEFGIYSDKECTQSIAQKDISFKTDKYGALEVSNIKAGTYYIKETNTLEGYLPDETVYEATISGTAKRAEIMTVQSVKIKDAEEEKAKESLGEEEDPLSYKYDAATEEYIRQNINEEYSRAQKIELRNYLETTYSLVDMAKVPKGATIDSVILSQEQTASLLGMTPVQLPVYNFDDESEYYVTYVDLYKDFPNHVWYRDAAFANNNIRGELLYGAVIDYETGIAYIPKDFFYIETKDLQGVDIPEGSISDTDPGKAECIGKVQVQLLYGFEQNVCFELALSNPLKDRIVSTKLSSRRSGSPVKLMSSTNPASVSEMNIATYAYIDGSFSVGSSFEVSTNISNYFGGNTGYAYYYNPYVLSNGEQVLYNSIVYSSGALQYTGLTLDSNYPLTTLQMAGSVGTDKIRFNGSATVKMRCTHVGSPYGYVSGAYSSTSWLNTTVRFTVMAMDANSIVLGVITPITEPEMGQAGMSIFRVGVSDKTSTITIYKKDAETGAPLAGATITRYTSAACTQAEASLVTNSNGYVQFSVSARGTYYFKETAAPAGYAKDTGVKTVISPSGTTVSAPVFSTYKGGLTGNATKVAAVGCAPSYGDGAYYQIGVYCTNHSNVINVKVYDTYSGTATNQFTLPLYGGGQKYTNLTKVQFYQTFPWSRQYSVRFYDQNWTQFGEITVAPYWPDATVKDTKQTCKIRIRKTDRETGEVLSGAVYGIYSDAACTNLKGTLTTGEDGCSDFYTVAEKLTQQEYIYIKEITAPDGYEVEPQVVYRGFPNMSCQWTKDIAAEVTPSAANGKATKWYTVGVSEAYPNVYYQMVVMCDQTKNYKMIVTRPDGTQASVDIASTGSAPEGTCKYHNFSLAEFKDIFPVPGTYGLDLKVADGTHVIHTNRNPYEETLELSDVVSVPGISSTNLYSGAAGNKNAYPKEYVTGEKYFEITDSISYVNLTPDAEYTVRQEVYPLIKTGEGLTPGSTLLSAKNYSLIPASKKGTMTTTTTVGFEDAKAAIEAAGGELNGSGIWVKTSIYEGSHDIGGSSVPAVESFSVHNEDGSDTKERVTITIPNIASTDLTDTVSGGKTAGTSIIDEEQKFSLTDTVILDSLEEGKSYYLKSTVYPVINGDVKTGDGMTLTHDSFLAGEGETSKTVTIERQILFSQWKSIVSAYGAKVNKSSMTMMTQLYMDGQETPLWTHNEDGTDTAETAEVYVPPTLYTVAADNLTGGKNLILDGADYSIKEILTLEGIAGIAQGTQCEARFYLMPAAYTVRGEKTTVDYGTNSRNYITSVPFVKTFTMQNEEQDVETVITVSKQEVDAALDALSRNRTYGGIAIKTEIWAPNEAGTMTRISTHNANGKDRDENVIIVTPGVSTTARDVSGNRYLMSGGKSIYEGQTRSEDNYTIRDTVDLTNLDGSGFEIHQTYYYTIKDEVTGTVTNTDYVAGELTADINRGETSFITTKLLPKDTVNDFIRQHGGVVTGSGIWIKTEIRLKSTGEVLVTHNEEGTDALERLLIKEGIITTSVIYPGNATYTYAGEDPSSTNISYTDRINFDVTSFGTGQKTYTAREDIYVRCSDTSVPMSAADAASPFMSQTKTFSISLSPIITSQNRYDFNGQINLEDLFGYYQEKYPGAKLEDISLCFTTSLYDDSQLILIHNEEGTDTAQMLHFAADRKITDSDAGPENINYGENKALRLNPSGIQIKDTVSYEGLVPGETVYLRETLGVKGTFLPNGVLTGITSTVPLTPEGSSGTKEASLSASYSEIMQVMTDNLLHWDSGTVFYVVSELLDADGNILFTHNADGTNENQKLTLITPEISTVLLGNKFAIDDTLLEDEESEDEGVPVIVDVPGYSKKTLYITSDGNDVTVTDYVMLKNAGADMTYNIDESLGLIVDSNVISLSSFRLAEVTTTFSPDTVLGTNAARIDITIPRADLDAALSQYSGTYLNTQIYASTELTLTHNNIAVVNTKHNTAGTDTAQKISLEELYPVSLEKESSQPQITSGRKNYTLKGAQFTLYEDSAATVPVKDFNGNDAVIITDADGKGSADNLKAGTYYLKETKAPRGFAQVTDVFSVTAGTGQSAVVTISDPPSPPTPEGPDSFKILTKVDAYTKDPVEGARYTVCFYDLTREDIEGNTDEDLILTQPLTQTPLYTWVFETNKDGMIVYDQSFLVDSVSDALVTLDSGEVYMPFGIYTVKELSAPEGYKTGEETHVIIYEALEDGSTNIEGQMIGEKPYLEEPERGDFHFTKTDSEGNALKGVEFKIESADSGEVEYIITDENGNAGTNLTDHSVDTNDRTKTPHGTWFGDTDRLNDDFGALPVGDYTVTEIRGEGNKDTMLISFDVTIEEDDTDIDLGTFADPGFTVETDLTDNATGDKIAIPTASDNKYHIKDAVSVKIGDIRDSEGGDVTVTPSFVTEPVFIETQLVVSDVPYEDIGDNPDALLDTKTITITPQQISTAQSTKNPVTSEITYVFDADEDLIGKSFDSVLTAWAKETSSDEGFVISVHNAGYDVPSQEVSTEIKGSIKIHKADGEGTDLEGVTYELVSADKSITLTGTTGSDGICLFDEIDPRKFEGGTLTETGTLPGYTLLSEPVTIHFPVMTAQELDALNPVEKAKLLAKASFVDSTGKAYFYDITLEITDHAAFDIPVAGSSGTHIPVTAGIIAAVLLLAALIRRRRE